MSTRRGGLGRGLGALIQNTAEIDGPSAKEDSSPSAASSNKTAAAPAKRSTRTAKTAESSQNGLPELDGATQQDHGSDRTEKTASSATASRKTSRSTGSKGAKTSEPTATRSTHEEAPRPADIFFGGGEGTSDDPPESGRHRPTRSARPSMPTVKAPSKRAPKSATEQAAPIRKDEHEGTVSADIAVLRELPVGDIHPNPRQPREVFDEDHMAELVASITEVGVLQPIVVREVEGAATPYELIMGERRWRATQRAGLATIPAIVRQTPDQDLLRDALLENLHRSQLNPLEEAAAYQQLMEDFSCTQEELSQRIGRSRPQISNTLRLLKLPPLVQRRVAAGALTAGHARALLGLADPAEMERLAQRIVSEGLSVRATEDAVAQLQGAVRPAPKSTRSREESTRHERLDYFATALTSRLDTQVKITLGARKGKIAIDFASVEDLNRIMDLIQGGGDSAPTKG